MSVTRRSSTGGPSAPGTTHTSIADSTPSSVRQSVALPASHCAAYASGAWRVGA